MRAMKKIYKLDFNADYYYDKAADFSDAGKPGQAVYNYYRSLSLEPFNPWTMSDIGMCYFELGVPAEALDWFNRALAIDKNCCSAAFGIVQIMAASGNYGAAERFIPLCAREDLDDYLESGEFFAGAASGSENEDTAPFRLLDKDIGLRLLSSALEDLQKGDVSASEEKLRAIDVKSKAYCEAMYYLALILYDRGDFYGALAVSEKMTENCPGQIKTYIIRLAVCSRLEMEPESREATEKLGKLDPGDFSESVGVAFCLSDIGMYDIALRFYKNAVKLQPYHKTALLLLGLCYHNVGDNEHCREIMVNLCKLYPEDCIPAYYARYTFENPGVTVPLVSDLNGRASVHFIGEFLREINSMDTIEQIENKYDEDDAFYDRMMAFFASGVSGAVKNFVGIISGSRRLRPVLRELLVRVNTSLPLKTECLAWILTYEKRKEFALIGEDGTIDFFRASAVSEPDDVARSVYCFACAMTKIAHINVDKQLKAVYSEMKIKNYDQLCNYGIFRENAAWLCKTALQTDSAVDICRLIGADEKKFGKAAEIWEIKTDD